MASNKPPAWATPPAELVIGAVLLAICISVGATEYIVKGVVDPSLSQLTSIIGGALVGGYLGAKSAQRAGNGTPGA